MVRRTKTRLDRPAERSAEQPGVWPFQLAVVTHGEVTDADRDLAAEKVAALSDEIERPVLFGRVKLTRHGDPAAAHPSTVQALLDVDGTVVRARAAADTMREAIDFAVASLRERLHVKELWDRYEGAPAVPGEWRHGNALTTHLPWFERPIDEREIVRRKGIGGEVTTVEEAVFDTHVGDYDFYLFTEESTGLDGVIVRTGGERDEVQFADLERAVTITLPSAVRLSTVRPPRLTEQGATDWLDVTGERFVFFVDPATERGAVLYRRLDGHYGLICTNDR